MLSPQQIDPSLLYGQAGLERESLRVNQSNGKIALSPHPQSLGSSLTHPNITTDFSEAQLEIVSPPFHTLKDLSSYMLDLHAFVAHNLPPEEILWSMSMPPTLAGEQDIPIATFGSANSGKVKEIYRMGLTHRYGRKMQAISGIHFNFSFPNALWDFLYERHGKPSEYTHFISEQYMGVLRNYRRMGWLMTYLFGCSPALEHSFLSTTPTDLELMDKHTCYGPYATSLRMSNIGYISNFRCKYFISSNSLENYIKDIYHAVSTPCSDFAQIGVLSNGQYLQLNDHILQIENEYYSLIRAKQTPKQGERPLTALAERGVSYIEIRGVDINPYSPIGITSEQMHIFHLFLIYCLLTESPPLEKGADKLARHNQHQVAFWGRKPNLYLRQSNQDILLQDWGKEILEALAVIAEWVDQETLPKGGIQTQSYTHWLRKQFHKVENPDRTPSAQILMEMKQNKESFMAFGQRLSHAHMKTLKAHPLSEAFIQEYNEKSSQSLAEQQRLEQENHEPLAAYIDRLNHLELKTKN